VEKGVFNRVTFKPIKTSALRIEVKSRPGCGSGIIEWDVYADPKLARARELRRRLAALDRLKCAPNRSALIERVLQSKGLSPGARQYLARLAEFKSRGEKLRAAAASGKPVDAQALGSLAGEVNRFFSEQVEQLGPIVFFTRHPLARPNAINCHIWQSVPERFGCSIRIYDPGRPELPARTIFSDPAGSIFDMNLSRDAKTLFFSYRKQSEKCWQVYQIGVDGRGLKKVSRDGQYHEVGAIELPGGELLFVSTRRGGFTVCQPGPCSNLHVMRRDGSDVRCVSQNTLSDFSPQMLPDGRVLFTRWEYIDRDLTYRQSLWTQNPDGRHYQLFFGNTIRDVGTFWQARPVPGKGNLLVATFAPHHGWPHGAIGLIDNSAGLEAPRGKGFAWITQEFPQIFDRSFRWSYRDPFPVNDYQFLVAYGGGGRSGPFALYLLDLCDNKTPIYADPATGCYGPLLLRPAKTPPLLPALKHDGNAQEDHLQWGTALVADVYRGLPGIERGRVKHLRIMEQMRKTRDLTHRAYDQSPLMSYATYYAKRCWGRVPVEPDGSAHFKVPALREVYFQVLDAEGRELQRQTSAVQLMPGETQSCVGCHEPRNTSPPVYASQTPTAFRRAPSRPEPPAWGNRGIIDFCKLVQPVLESSATAAATRTAGATCRAIRRGCSTWPTTTCWAAADPTGNTTWPPARCCRRRRPRASRWCTSIGCCKRPRRSIGRCGPARTPAGSCSTSRRITAASQSPRPIGSGSTPGSTPTCRTTPPTPTAAPLRPAIATCAPTWRPGGSPRGTRSGFWACITSGAARATAACRTRTTRGPSGTAGWRGSISPDRSTAPP